LEKRQLKTSIGLLVQQRLQGAQKPKPKIHDFSSDTASADAFAAKLENARSGLVHVLFQTLRFVEKKGKM
jgi:hypothetical protein